MAFGESAPQSSEVVANGLRQCATKIVHGARVTQAAVAIAQFEANSEGPWSDDLNLVRPE